MKTQNYFFRKPIKTGLILLTFWVALFPQISFAQKDTVKVIIVHVNDMHSQINNMSKLAFFIDSLKKTNPYVFLVSAGDNFTGNPVVDLYEEKGYPMIDLMNRCGFNLSAIGNHEFDMGQDLMNQRFAQARFPFICCNIDTKLKSGAVLKQPKPYYILEAGKVKIPVIGVLQLGQKGIPDSHPERLQGLFFTQGIKTVKENAGLKNKYGSLIVLSHLGVETDVQLAKRIPDLDVIIGGHSHTVLKRDSTIKRVMIVQTGSNLRNVGMLTLKFLDKKIVKKEYKLIPCAAISGVDTTVQKQIDLYNNNEKLNTVIGYTEKTIKGESELGNLMTDALTQQLHVDFAFQNSGGIRIDSLPKGDIKLSDIYRLDPFGNYAVILKMNSDEIATLLLNAYKMGNKPDLQVSGLRYTVVLTPDNEIKEIKLVDLKKNSELLKNKQYSVAMNSYIFAQYPFKHADKGYTLPTTCAEHLINYLTEKKNTNDLSVGRISVVKE